jgi:hypothetical protein
VEAELNRQPGDVDAFVVDEIGKMECMSPVFVDAVTRILDSSVPVLATIAAKLLLRNNLAVGIICLFRCPGWGDGHGRPSAQANPSLSVSRMSFTQ